MTPTLAICACIKNEATYLAEWIAFHRLVGVSRFYLYDDESEDDTILLLRKLDRGDIVLHPHGDGWDCADNNGVVSPQGWHMAPQTHAFVHHARTYAHLETWCAFVDPDEFLWHTHVPTLPDYLAYHGGHACVVAPWIIFGSNGHVTRPPGLVIESYTRRAPFGLPDPYGRHVKPIVRMSAGPQWGFYGSHVPFFPEPALPVTEDGLANPWSMLPGAPTHPRLRCHHYYHRSQEEAQVKLVRGYHNIPPNYPGPERLAAHDRNEVADESILRYLPALKESISCG